MDKEERYELVWGGDCDGIYRVSDGRQAVSSRDFSEAGWYRLIGAPKELINKIGSERDPYRRAK